MRLFFLLLLLVAIDYYVFQPFQTILQPLSRPWRLAWQTAYWIIPLISLIFLLLYQTGNTHLLPGKDGKSIWSALLVLAYLCKALVLPFLFVDDLRRLGMMMYTWWNAPAPYMPSRSKFISTVGLAAGMLPFSLLLYGAWRNPYRYQVRRLRVPIPHLPEALEGLRIVQISDIHSGSFTLTEPVENAIRMINGLEADLVCFTGDLVNSQAVEMEPFKEMFSGIQSKLGVFSVLGNHDYGDYFRWPDPTAKQQNFETLLKTHREMGWDLLRNEHRLIECNGERIAIIGVENYSAHPRFHRYGDLVKASEGSDPASIKVLLSHDPSHWDDQVAGKRIDIDLTLSGHTHGMQFGVDIPGWFQWSPIQYMYKQWAGLYTKGYQHLYVNRGLGFLGYPGRVGILPEITLLELHKDGNA